MTRAAIWRAVGWSVAGLVLLLPLLGMQLTDQVRWSASDFAFLGVLLGGLGLGMELAVARSRSAAFRAAAGVALVTAFLLVWINAAVGVIGSEQQDANRLFGGVLGVALGGALMARLRPSGLSRAAAGAALAQALVPPIASASGLAPGALAWSPQTLGLTAVFTALWLLSALLFRKAAIQARPRREAET